MKEKGSGKNSSSLFLLPLTTNQYDRGLLLERLSPINDRETIITIASKSHLRRPSSNCTHAHHSFDVMRCYYAQYNSGHWQEGGGGFFPPPITAAVFVSPLSSSSEHLFPS